jgi:uncharacterized protein (DUF2336 family)
MKKTLDLWNSELDAALSQRSDDQRTTILRQMTDLFLTTADSLSQDHVVLFDDVMMRLVDHIEREALVELSERLAPIDNAPVNVIGRLSRNDDIAVSGPVLQKSSVLTDPDLIEIAQTKSQNHLLAIAGRASISTLVTTALVGRGNDEVALKVAANTGAHISSNTYLTFLKRARGDEAITGAVASRQDLPQEMFEQLVREATETVRQRLLAKSGPEMRERISKILAKIAAKVSQTPAALGGSRSLFSPDIVQLRAQVMHRTRAGDIPKLIDALAVLCRVPTKIVNDLVKQHLHEGIIILGKAGGLSWPELQDVLKVATPPMKSAELTALFDKYASLSAPKSQIAASFLRTTKLVSRAAIAKLM